MITKKAKQTVLEDVALPEIESDKEVESEWGWLRAKHPEIKNTQQLREHVIRHESELDPKLRPIVVDLVLSGFATTYSCQGGLGHEYPHGIIFLRTKTLTPEQAGEIREVVEPLTSTPFVVLKSTAGPFGTHCAAIKFAGPIE